MDKLNVEVNPQMEFMNSILLTSKHNEILTSLIGGGTLVDDESPYTKAIKAHFEKFQDHPVYTLIEQLTPKGFFLGRPVELMLSLKSDESFNRHYELSDLCVEYSGGMDTINHLLEVLKDLYIQSDYKSFFEQQVRCYQSAIQRVEKLFNTYDFIEYIENQYGMQQNSYNYVLTTLHKGSFGEFFKSDKEEQLDIYLTLTCCINTDNQELPFNKGPLSINLVFHEFSHPFINPLTTKYSNKVNEYAVAHDWLKKYKLPDFQSGYGDWEECVNEHLVRAMAIHLTKKCGEDQWAQEDLEKDLKKGYMYIPDILKQYTYYDNNRHIYKNFEAFYPTLLQVFAKEI